MVLSLTISLKFADIKFMQNVSIIVPVHQGGDAFLRCCYSLQALDPAPHEVIIVIDGMTPAMNLTRQWLQDRGFLVTALPQNLGPAAARNAGAHLASGDILFFLDADVAVPQQLLTTLAQSFQHNSHPQAVIGSYDDQPGHRGFLSQYRNLLHHHTHQSAQAEASTFWGACGAIQLAAFWAVNGFDERYRTPCVEDIDLGYRLRQAGYTIRLDKQLQVKHLKQWTLATMVRADIFYRAIPWTGLLLKNQAFNQDLNLDIVSRLSLLLTYGMVFVSLLAIGHPILGVTLGLMGLALLGLNRSLYHFFWFQRGWWFCLKAIPLHWLYFLYGGLGFFIGCCKYYSVGKPKLRSKSKSKPPMAMAFPSQR